MRGSCLLREDDVCGHLSNEGEEPGSGIASDVVCILRRMRSITHTLCRGCIAYYLNIVCVIFMRYIVFAWANLSEFQPKNLIRPSSHPRRKKT